MNEHEAAQRNEPKAGEHWYFSNGRVAEIMEPEMNSGSTFPEIAIVDPDAEKIDGWKFNSSRDPLPIRRVDGPERPKPLQRYGHSVTINVIVPFLESEYEDLRKAAVEHMSPHTVRNHIRGRLGLPSIGQLPANRRDDRYVSEERYLHDFNL